MLTYAIEVLTASVLLAGGYFLLKKWYSVGIRRMLLLTCIVVPLILPLINLEFTFESTPNIPVNVETYFEANDKPSKNTIAESGINAVMPETNINIHESDHEMLPGSQKFITGDWILLIYSIITTFLIIKLSVDLFLFFRLKRKSEAVEKNGTKISIVADNHFIGASFFKWIFIGEKYLEHENYEVILLHEKSHVDRLHSFDLLLADIINSLFWFNPINWILRKEIKLNNELEADADVVREIDTIDYSNMLIGFSSKDLNSTFLNTMSSWQLKQRIAKLTRPNRATKKTRLLFLSPFYLLSFWLVSCSIQTDAESGKVLENIKSITTRFTSHQGDTQNKDARVVAVAQFNIDGTIEGVTQHMTYPYNLKEPEDRHLWMKPDPKNLTHIMDGLKLGMAENNLLYGNDWPLKYAKIDPLNHPRAARRRAVENGMDMLVTFANGEWPEELQIVEKFDSFVDENRMSPITFYETFTNDGRFITGYRDGIIHPPEFIKAMRVTIEASADDRTKKEKLASLTEPPKEPNVLFYYIGDNLDRVESNNRTYKFYFNETKQLIRSEFYIKEKVYNTRHYFYDENGLKERTEIFNVDGEPEYTINYEYEFYQVGD